MTTDQDQSNTEFWEQWVGSRKEPVDYVQRDAKVTRATERQVTVRDDLFGGSVEHSTRPGRKLITFSFVSKRDGKSYTCENMPENALTAACRHRRHADCNHRLGAIAEGGVLLAYGPERFVWRCGCDCHHEPTRAGMLL